MILEHVQREMTWSRKWAWTLLIPRHVLSAFLLLFFLHIVFQIEDVELIDKKGYLIVSLTLSSKEGSKILLRKPEGIKDWFQAIKVSNLGTKKERTE